MKIKLLGQTDEILKGSEILSKRLGYEITDNGFPVFVTKTKGPLNIKVGRDRAEITYEEKIHFFRGLGILRQYFGKETEIKENIVFRKNGVMIDASRNAVMHQSAICNFIEIMAIMGLNLLMFYTEDTYEVPGYPYFGYMRGRYTFDELKACDDYADIFGIEMIPCIQLMGRLVKAIKWEQNGLNIRDTQDNILIGSEDTYIFLKDLLKAATAPYRSKRVHIGMDEAWYLGLGRSIKEFGYRTPGELIAEHFPRIKEIVDELGIDPIMWPDMFFRATNPERRYNDSAVFTQEIIDAVPKNAGLVYYDYYSDEESHYDKMIKKHKELGENVLFAGGVWTWGNMNINYTRAIKVTVPALRACQKNNIREVFTTMWGDDGNQCNVYEALYGMQLYAEMGYGYDYDENWISDRFFACTGENANAFLSLGTLDNIGQENYKNANPSQYLLWQDPLIGLLDAHIDREDLPEIYAQRRELMLKNAEESQNYSHIFKYAAALAGVLELKADLGIRLKKAHDTNDKAELSFIHDNVLPELIKRVDSLKIFFRNLWDSSYKPFGFEVIDMRLGALVSRIGTASYRIEQYLSGEIYKISELVPERLPYKLFDGEYFDGLNVRTLSYAYYVSAGCFAHEIFD